MLGHGQRFLGGQITMVKETEMDFTLNNYGESCFPLPKLFSLYPLFSIEYHFFQNLDPLPSFLGYLILGLTYDCKYPELTFNGQNSQ